MTHEERKQGTPETFKKWVDSMRGQYGYNHQDLVEYVSIFSYLLPTFSNKMTSQEMAELISNHHDTANPRIDFIVKYLKYYCTAYTFQKTGGVFRITIKY